MSGLLPWSPRAWRATVSGVLDFLYGLIVGVVLITGLVVGVSTLVIGIGFVVLVATLTFARLASSVYRYKQGLVVGADIEGRAWPSAALDESSARQFWRYLSDRGLWLEALHGVLMVPLGTLWYVLVTVLWSVALAALAFPVYAVWVPDGPAVDWAGFDPRDWKGRLGIGLAGVALAFLASWVAHLTARASTATAGWLLTSGETEQLRARVEELTSTRAAVVVTADEERQRIERDLHDGVQPHLVSLAMSLGMAQRKLDQDVDGARALVDQAHGEAKQAIAELRRVIRGAHPAVLTERGLDPALSGLAARSPVPVQVDVSPEVGARRFPARVEAVAYYAVAEALTNVAKHSFADTAQVRVALRDDVLVVTITDDGVGGASSATGSGLAGLGDRVAAVDGRMHLESPPGAGTVLTLEVPCAS